MTQHLLSSSHLHITHCHCPRLTPPSQPLSTAHHTAPPPQTLSEVHTCRGYHTPSHPTFTQPFLQKNMYTEACSQSSVYRKTPPLSLLIIFLSASAPTCQIPQHKLKAPSPAAPVLFCLTPFKFRISLLNTTEKQLLYCLEVSHHEGFLYHIPLSDLLLPSHLYNPRCYLGQDLTMEPQLTLNSLCRPSWPGTHRESLPPECRR